MEKVVPMTNNVHDDFKFTMSGLEKGLQVVHITTPSIQGCDINDDIGEVLNNQQLLPFDLLPVRQNGHIVGVIRRGSGYPSNGSVRDYMHSLDESVLISAEMPLLEYISIDPLDRLVLQGINICGIVTRSDLLKLPVRLLAFSLVTHIEVLMSKLIRITGVNEQTWLPFLEENGRGKKISKKQQQLRAKHSDPDMLEHTYFSDKQVIISRLFNSKETAIHELLTEEAIDQLKEIKELRNTVAHTGNDIESQDPIQDFIRRLRLAQAWIDSFPDEQILAGKEK